MDSIDSGKEAEGKDGDAAVAFALLYPLSSCSKTPDLICL